MSIGAQFSEPIMPRPNWAWFLEIENPDGFIPIAWIQSFKPPKQVLFEKALRGMGHAIKVTTGYSCEDMSLKKIKPADLVDDFAWTWFTKQYNPLTKRLGHPSNYKYRAMFHQLDGDNQPQETQVYIGLKVKEIDLAELAAQTPDDIFMEELTLSADARIR